MSSDKPWLASYPASMRWDLAITPTPVQKILEDTVKRFPDQYAVDFMGKRITYRELGALTDRGAKGLQALGVGPGVHVGIFLPNSPHTIIAFFSILKAGGTVVNYSPLDAAKVLEHKIEDSETDFLFTLDLAALYPQMGSMLGKTRLKKLIVGNVGEMTPAPEAVAAKMKEAKETVEVPWDDRHVKFADLLANDGAYTPHPIDNPADAIAVLQYTGGTTGLPKGAMLTHGNLSAAAEQYHESTQYDPPLIAPGTERLLGVLPPFHIYALTVNMLFGIRLGAEIVQHMRFDPKAALEDIANKKIAMFCGVPTMFTALISHPDTPKYDLRSLKYCGSGGAPLPVEVGQRYTAITGTEVSEGWGMTETSPTGTFSPIKKSKPGSCGIPLPGITIKLLSLDDPTKYVPLGEKGEMCISGPNIMKGYWKNPEATAADTTFDGFFRTGDVAYMDEDGYLFIVDRCKDMLLCSGFNVYPRVLEEAIYQHPSVNEVCVIGIPDTYRGQSPKAFVVLKPGAEPFTLEQLQAFLKDKLGKHEMVHALEIRDALPKTAVGKLSKKDLVDEEARKRAATA
ncbi:MAG: long-chain fatty acid--CoA ligase [Acidovorax sp.]|uniref:long-chain-fatty-acid--CoA ligase n=1 Tax=Acidovorax sp. TaxID=1872122 RepID=UPI0039E267BB